MNQIKSLPFVGSEFFYDRIRFFACILYLLTMTLLMGYKNLRASEKFVPATDSSVEVGVARIDISPEGPIRLAGYGGRESESEGVLQKLWAKALAFGSDTQGPSIFITVDLIGIPGHITEKVAQRLSEKTAITPSQLVISASHTHTGPEVGNLLNHFGKPMPPKELGRIIQNLDKLTDKLHQLALAALEDRSPARVAWGQGEVGFAMNRRFQSEIRPVDHSMPLLRVTDPNGRLRAVLVNYACHGTTLTGDVNKIHGDWMGEAQRIIEERHPGATAMVAIGAGADANPDPRGKIRFTTQHGREIANEVDSLLNTGLQPLTSLPVGHRKFIELPFEHIPTTQELTEQALAGDSQTGYYARLALDRKARGEAIPTSLSYPVQTWTFGDDLAMIFLAGEVVVDYSLRLKKELAADRLWVTAYANAVPSYIASRRVIQEGGYEAESSQYSYNRPSPYVKEIEDLIIRTVHELLPASFGAQKTVPTTEPEVVRPDKKGALHLRAEMGRPTGPNIQYMPEWRAFGWFFTKEDRVEWDVVIEKEGRYEVYLEWSVSDEEAGKSFVFQAGDQQIQGTINQSGSWERFRTQKIGTIELLAGEQKMIFESNPKAEKGPLLDLRKLKLVPIE